MLARSRSPLYVPFQFAFPSRGPEIFRKIGRTKSCFVVSREQQVGAGSRRSSNLLRSIFGRGAVSPISSLEKGRKREKIFYIRILSYTNASFPFLSENNATCISNKDIYICIYVSLSVILLIATFTNEQRPNKKKKKKKEKMQNE